MYNIESLIFQSDFLFHFNSMKYLILLFLLNPLTCIAQELYHVSVVSAGVYSESNTSSTLLVNLKNGTEVQMIKMLASGWSRIKSGSTLGFIESSKITAGKAPESKKAEKAELYHVSVYQSVLYSEKSPDSKIQNLSRDAELYLINNDGTWARVQYQGKLGYVYATHIKKGKAEKEEKIETVTTMSYVVNIPNTQLFSEATTSSKVLKTFAKGDLLEVVKIIDGGTWAKVRIEKGFSYVKASSIKKAPSSGGGVAKGQTKNPTKAGAVCRDGTIERGSGRDVCAKHNGVRSWIYRPAK